MDTAKLHCVDNFYQQALLTVPPNAFLLDVIAQMSQAHSSCALILAQQQLIGIFTEGDVLRAMSNVKHLDIYRNYSTFEQIAITDFMTQPVITLSETEAEDMAIVLERFHQHRIRHLPVIDSQGQVVRVITPQFVMDKISHHCWGKTAGREREITQPQPTSQLVTNQQILLNDILDHAIATCITSFRVFANRDWVYDYQSVGCETLFGYTPQEIANDKNLWLSQVHPQDLETVIFPLFEDFFAERTTSVEYRFHHKDGSERWLSANYTSRYDAVGNCWIVICNSHDISECKQVEAELKERNHFIEQIVHHSPQLLYIFDPTTGCNFYVNNQSVEILGYTPQEIQQRGAKFFLEVFHPEDLPLLERNFNHWKHAVDGKVLTNEYRMKHKNGTWRWLRSREIVFARDENNFPNRVLGITEDISEQQAAKAERQRAEAALRKSEALLVESQKVARLGNWEYDSVSSKISWSKQLFHLFNRDMALGEPNSEEMYQIFCLEDRQKLAQAIQRTISTGESYKLLLRVLQADASIMYIEAIGNAEFNSEGQVIRLYGTVQDITERKLIEDKLSQAKLRYRTLIEQIPGVVYISPTIANSEFAYISPQIQNLLNIPPHQFIPGFFNSWQNYVYPEDRDRVLQAVNTTIATGEPLMVEYRMITHDGKIIWVQDRCTLVLAADGKTPILQGFALDITERKQEKQALQEKESFLRSIYDGFGEPIFVIDVVDNDFRFVGVNPVCERFTGISSQELQGNTPEQVFSPSVAAAVRQHYQDCVTTGNTINYEECLSFIGQEEWWLTSLTPLRDENSRIYRIVGNSVNITERKRTEQMLELQAVITRNMAEGICLISATDGVFVYTNPKFEQMFGYEAGELIGQDMAIINYGNNHTNPVTVYESLAANIIQNGEATFELHNVKKDGTQFWCCATASVFEHPEYGTVFVVVQQDITEQKQAKEKIKASLKEKEVLLQEIHHRVKNNLGIVSSLLQMQYRRTQDSQVKAILQDSQNRIASIALVHEKLYCSPTFANIDFAQYITDLTTHLFDTYNVNYSQVQLKTQVDHISLDLQTAIPCGLILNELVSNALKYAFPDNISGDIQVKFYSENDWTFILMIADNGVGLPADFNHQKFHTLGLTLVHGLVKQLQGRIEINTQQGTKFKITFTKGKE